MCKCNKEDRTPAGDGVPGHSYKAIVGPQLIVKHYPSIKGFVQNNQSTVLQSTSFKKKPKASGALHKLSNECQSDNESINQKCKLYVKSTFHTGESVLWSICCNIAKSYKYLGFLNLKRQLKIIIEF